MRIPLVLLALILGAAPLGSEELYQLVQSPQKAPPTMPKGDYKRGQVDKEGNLIFLTLHHSRNGTRNIAMTGDYGAMIFYDETSGEEGYEFYSKKDRKIFETASFDEFLKLVGGMPRGSRLDLYNLCLGGTHYGYPKAKWERIDAVSKKAGIAFDREESKTSCTCEGAKD